MVNEDGGRTDAERGGHLDLARTREVFDSSTDFTIGLEEEFAIVDPRDARAAAPLRRPLLGMPDRRSPRRVRGWRADRVRDRDPLRARPRPSPRRWSASESAGPGCSGSPMDLGLALAATGTHPWASYLDQQIIDTPHYARLREELRLGGTAKQHLEPSRPRRRARGRSGDRRVRPPARPAPDPARGVGQLALPGRPATPASTRCAPRSSPGPSRAAGCTSRSGPGTPTRTSWSSWSVRARSSRRLSCGGAFAPTTPSAPSSCASATRRPGARSRSGSPPLIVACIAQSALDYDEGRLRASRCASARSRRTSGGRSAHGMDGKLIDFDRGEEVPAPAAVERIVEWTAAGPERRSAWSSRSPRRTAPSAPRRRSPRAPRSSEIYRGAVEETRRTYAPRASVNR